MGATGAKILAVLLLPVVISPASNGREIMVVTGIVARVLLLLVVGTSLASSGRDRQGASGT